MPSRIRRSSLAASAVIPAAVSGAAIQTADFPHLLAPQLIGSIGPGVRIHQNAANPPWPAPPVQG